jgi:hypothetical protein
MGNLHEHTHTHTFLITSHSALLTMRNISEKFNNIIIYFSGDKIKKNEMGWACGAYG